MIPFVVSSFIEGVDLYPPDLLSNTEVGYAIHEQIDAQSFKPSVLPISSTDELSRPQITTPVQSDYDRALGRLREFKRWPNNWDGEGAEKPDPAIMDRAIALSSLIACKPVSFGIGLDAESRPMFTIRDRKYDGHIVVESDGAVSYFFERDENVIDDYDLAFDGRTLPHSLELALSRI